MITFNNIKLPSDYYQEENIEMYKGISIMFENEMFNEEKLEIKNLLDETESLFSSKSILVKLNQLIKNLVVTNTQACRKKLQETGVIGTPKSKIQGSTSSYNYKPGTFGGVYGPNQEVIFLSTNKEHRHKGGILKIFVHELSHALHISYIHKDAKNYWDDSSNSVIRYFKRLDALNDEFKKLNLENEEKINKLYLYFIEELIRFRDSMSSSSITNNSTKSIFDNIDNFYDENMDQNKIIYNNIVSNQTNNIIVEDFNEAQSFLNHVILKFKFMFPTKYALTNNQEDFAECFTMFLLKREKLSDWNINRMNNTLAKSNNSGVKIIKESIDLNVLKNYVKILLESLSI